MGTTCNNLAGFLEDQSRGEEAEALYRRDLEISERLAAAHPARVDLQLSLAISLGNFLIFLLQQKRTDEYTCLHPRLKKHVQLLERMLPHHPQVQQLMVLYEQLPVA
ncbi:MAG: tetratricopeptide repeat protein [Calditrichaeota bacterium]|nr:MAG: tetratricopeptide repeat protein [Calditrichota bacterium]